MDRMKKAGLYIACILSGIYTADMIYRIVRYISVLTVGDAFEKTVMFIGTVFQDGGSFMYLSVICAALLALSSLLTKLFMKKTVAALVINLVSCVVFMISVSINNIELSTLLHISVITIPLYLLTGLWCIYFCIKDLCRHFLNNTNEENNK